MSKSLFTSKTFWFNVLSAAATVAGVVPLDPQVAVYVISGINIALRVLTQGPVHVVQDAAKE